MHTWGGGGGHVSLGPVHHPRKSLSEKHEDEVLNNFDTLYGETVSEQDTVRAHRGIAPKFPTLSTDRPL